MGPKTACFEGISYRQRREELAPWFYDTDASPFRAVGPRLGSFRSILERLVTEIRGSYPDPTP